MADAAKIIQDKQERAKLVTDIRSMIDEFETKEMPVEKRAELTKLETRFDQLNASIQTEERQLERERLMGAPNPDENRKQTPADEEVRTAFSKALTGDPSHIAEYRNLSAGSPTQAGYLVAPMAFVNQIIKGLDDAVYIRQMATKKGPINNSQSLGFPYRKTRMSDADWTSELLTGNEDTALDYGLREFKPNKLAKKIKVSKRLLDLVNADVEVRSEIDYVVGITLEKAYLTGPGVAQPLGVFTASNAGISTARDVSTGNTATEIKPDNLKNVKYTLKQGYWGKAAWMFHRDAMKMLAKMKDGNGQYLWQQSIAAGQPDRLENFPVIMSEFCPNTFTTGLYVGMLGDFSQYWIADGQQMEIQVLRELYAETGQIGYLVDYYGDGAPVMEEAFVRVKLA